MVELTEDQVTEFATKIGGIAKNAGCKVRPRTRIYEITMLVSVG